MIKKFPLCHKTREVKLSTVSGVASTKPSLIKFFDTFVPSVDIITTKSFQVKPNSGNREPIITEDNLGTWGNSVGLRNPGMDEAVKEIKHLRKERLNKWLNVSLSADNEDDFITLVNAFSPYADSVELNFSCPHAKKGFGASIGSDINIASSYTKKINEATKNRECLLFIKLTPNVPNIGEIAKAVVSNGADGIVAINTVGPVDHIDKVSCKPILQNAIGGKGGQSGDDIFPIALSAVKEIRRNIPDDIPLIAMGGVSDGERAALLIESGADAIGIGSALGRVKQENWEEYFKRIKKEAESILKEEKVELTSRELLRKHKVTEYEEHTVKEIKMHTEDTMLLILDGEVSNFKVGEFVFLWIPGVGEKPFSLALSSPLTFIIKKRGIFTSHLFSSLKEGDKIYIRGPYGDEAESIKSKKAIIIVGGTGEAVAAPLSEKLKKDGVKMSFLVGTSLNGNRGILESTLREKGNYKCISDDGKIGRVLDYIEDEINSSLDSSTSLSDIAFYLVGPEIFMKNGAIKLRNLGVKPEMILLSMERNTMCGVGLCGECVCGHTLMCQHGTFFTLSRLLEEGAL